MFVPALRDSLSRWWWLIVPLALLFLLSWHADVIHHDPAYRESLEYVGDPLPDAKILLAPTDVSQFFDGLDATGRKAFATLLLLEENLKWWLLCLSLVIALGTAFLDLARRSSSLVALAIGVMLCSVYENKLLIDALGQTKLPAGLANEICLAIWLKRVLLLATFGFGATGFLRMFGTFKAWCYAFLQDVPFIVDALWRRADLLANREFRYEPMKNTVRIAPRVATKPAFVFFGLTLLFIAYGPTIDGLCTVAPRSVTEWLTPVAACGTLLALVFIWLRIRDPIEVDIRDRFLKMRELKPSPGKERPGDEELNDRESVTRGVLFVGLILLFLPVVYACLKLMLTPALYACRDLSYSDSSVSRLCAWAIVMVAFAGWMQVQKTTRGILFMQAFLALVFSLFLWMTLADPKAVEADGTPYRHVYAALAPFLLVLLAAAPCIAHAFFHVPQFSPRFRWFFVNKLRTKELFVDRSNDYSYVALSRFVFALLQGASRRTLQLAVVPALLAFIAPPDWTTAAVWYGLGLSLLLAIWGNMSRRWQQLAAYVDRWFLSGIASFVSVFVVAVSTARILQINYVTTILDATPFGVLFAFVAMSYVLSWLMDYWIQRALADELLNILARNNGVEDVEGSKLNWIISEKARSELNPRVDWRHRFLSYHSIGRFLVIGPLQGRDGNSEYAKNLANFCEPKTAFHSYELTELFQVLAGEERDEVADIIRRSSLYRYTMSGILVLAFVAFGLCGWYHARTNPDAVIKADGGDVVKLENLKDLSHELLAGKQTQPSAIVFVASGGGTRAALYASHVLQGLYGIGALKDVVLLSGVSGGAVALSYFATRFKELSDPKAQPNWNDFRDAVSGNLIFDVLKGASEWRIYATAPLTVLLSESFDRHLRPRMGDFESALASGPALILNTTISGHSADDSRVLSKTLNRASVNGKLDCDEATRPYRLLNGGRLIFTNIRQISSFPTAKSEIPDVRLPYIIVRDTKIPLSSAAALSANFPPVFPNARVELTHAQKDPPCQVRSYYVTDGGAEENLGLVSALYAVQSALEGLPCKSKCKLRPIDFVIAEASAASYDYTQDRGVSAGIAGAKERMTGGLTEELIARTRELYVKRGGDPKCIRFHYLPLPLAFRARGGFGTHWMHASEIKVTDPRARTWPNWVERLLPDHPPTVTLSKRDVDDVWFNLHDPKGRYCEKRDYGWTNTDQVRRWLCGSPGDGDSPRDLHLVNWPIAVKQLRR